MNLKKSAVVIGQRLTAFLSSGDLSSEGRPTTDLKSSEGSKANERLHLFMEASFDGLWDWQMKTGETYVSPSYYQMLGYEPSDLSANVDALFIDLLHPADREATLSLVHKQLSSTGHYDLEFRMRCHDGTYKWINSRGKLIERDAQGAPSRAIGTHTDITERKLHELNLIESESRFKEIADCAPVMIWMSGLDKLCYFFNKTWLDFTGRTLEEESGHGWAEGVHPDDFDNCLKIYVESFDAQRPFSMDYRLRRHDGEFRWIQDAGIPRFNEEGQFLGYMGSCVDITERKQAEDYFRIIVEASPYAMLLLNDQGTIDLVNRELTTLFGYSSKELVGQFIETLVPKEIAKDHVQFRKAYLAQPTACSIGKERIVMGRRKNGTMFQAEIGLSPFYIGHRQYVISVVIDVTERKKAEQAILDLNASLEEKVKDRTEALEKASAAKTDFLASMSHEIRNPMNTINLSSYMLTRERLTEEQQSMVDRIVRSSKSLLAIVNEILDFSKIEAGQIDLDELPINLTDLLQNISDTQRMMATEKGLRFHAEIPEHLLSGVLCDAIRIEQILNNLISNAIKFTSEGDVWLRVKVTREDLGEISVYFEVADTGVGIPSEIIPRLGSPFMQADSSVMRKFGGTGLGLSIAKKLIQLMKGNLEIQSTPGLGSVFSFALTFARAKANSPSLIQPQRALRLNGIRVLLVGNDPSNVDGLNQLLTDEGATVTGVLTGPLAVNSLQPCPDDFDVILMDLQMPMMDGLLAARLIKERSQRGNLPIIGVTAMVLPHQQQEAMESGINQVLTKPIDPDELIRSIRAQTADAFEG